METKTIIGIIIAIIVVVGLALGLGLGLGLKDDKKDSGSAATPAAAAAATPAAAAATTFTLVAGPTSPSYGKAGYKPIPLANLPAKFTLKNTATGNFWGQNGDQVTDAATSVTIAAVSKSDIYSQTGTGTYTLTLNGDSTKSIRHAGYVMWYNNYTPGNFDFAWQLFLKDGTPDQVIVWNPFPGNNLGMHVKADGSRQKIDPGEPTVYKLTPVTSTSTYVPQPFMLF
jgi:hypothetical protein